MEFKYYSFIDALSKHSKCETLIKSLILVDPSISSNILNGVIELRNHRRYTESTMMNLLLCGIYVMKLDTKIVSCVFINKNKIDRIITLPAYRNKGYATILINHIVDNMTNKNIKLICSPVKPSAIPFFTKLGWIQATNKYAKDGTIDYCPKQHYTLYKMGRVELEISEWVKFLLSAR